MAASTSKAPPPLFVPASLKPKPTPVAPSLSSLPVNEAQVQKALTALLAHITKVQQQREETDLLGESEEKLFVVVGLKRAARREVHMPVRMQLAHPVIDPRQSPVTLFVKDPQRTYKDLLEKSKISFISRVVGLEKLRTKHKTFEAKRVLLKEGDLFLVDDRVVVDVGKSLGKMWREAKKQPVPVALQRKDLKAELERAVASTYLQISMGTSLSVKFGSTAIHTPAQLLENLLSLLPQLAVRLPFSEGDFSNIQSIHIKTSTSVALPIWNSSIEEVGKIVVTEKEKKEIEEKKAEKEKKEQERKEREEAKEKRRVERSATKEGKGRMEKKRKEPEAEAEEVVEEEVVPVSEPIVEAQEEVKERPSKKSKKAAAVVEDKAEEPKKKSKKVKATKA
ncbi:hypothetical protein MNV49_004030 [Pseudohyphozyma bogoriensis]|nr:hypothetical protein MNV49_004030 [Pseudohyphozyma bogoriensis]